MPSLTLNRSMKECTKTSYSINKYSRLQNRLHPKVHVKRCPRSVVIHFGKYLAITYFVKLPSASSTNQWQAVSDKLPPVHYISCHRKHGECVVIVPMKFVTIEL